MPKIYSLRSHILDLPLRETFETAARRADTSPTVLIEISAGDVVGWGEATPVAYVTGEDAQSVARDVITASDALSEMDLSKYRLISHRLKDVLPSSKSARAGVEMALLDAFTKSLGLPLYKYLGGAAASIETDVTIPITTLEHGAEKAVELAGDGFRTFKMKVGKDLDSDIERVRAVCDAVDDCSFVLDANQGYSSDQSIEFVKRLTSLGIRINVLEQPVNAADLDGLRRVKESVDVPVIADEAAQAPEDVLRIACAQAADGVNVKLMKSGVLGALDIISICCNTGLKLMFGCMLESSIGQSAAAHIACGTGAFSIFDLDSDMLISDQPIKGGFSRSGAVLTISDRPGLGCEVVESALESFLKRD